MGNMDYCRFQNTLSDLKDCRDDMEDEPQSKEEQRARLQLIELCVDIACDHGKIVNRRCREV